MEISLTLALVLINGGLSLYAFSNPQVFSSLLFNPYMCKHHRQWYRVLTHAFIHGDWIHLFFNMFVLYQFGGLIEQIFTEEQVFKQLFPELSFWGKSQGYLFLVLLYFGGLLAAVLPAFAKHSDNPAYNSVGASGAVSAVVLALIVLLPTMKLYLFFIPIGIPAFVLGIAYLIYEYVMSKRMSTGIAHDAHLWGGLFGLLLILLFNWRFAIYFYFRVADYIGI